MPTLSDISTRLAGLVDTLGSDQFLNQLVDTLCWQTQADDATIIIYEQGELPGIAYAKPLEGAAETALNTYLTGPFLLDPFYRADHVFDTSADLDGFTLHHGSCV